MLKDGQRLVLIQLGATRSMAISSDVPHVVTVAVQWLKVEDICEHLHDLNEVTLPCFWPWLLKESYASDWWNWPGCDPNFINTWDQEYLKDMTDYKAEVSQCFVLNHKLLFMFGSSCTRFPPKMRGPSEPGPFLTQIYSLRDHQ